MNWIYEQIFRSPRTEARRRRSTQARRPRRESRAFVVESPSAEDYNRNYRRQYRRPSPYPRGRQSSYQTQHYQGSSDYRSPSSQETTYHDPYVYSPRYTQPAEPQVPQYYEERQPRGPSKVHWADLPPPHRRATRPASPTYERQPSQAGQRYEVRISQDYREEYDPPISTHERKRQAYSHTPRNKYPILPLERERRQYLHRPRSSIERERGSYSYTPPSYEQRRDSSFNSETGYEIRSPRPRFSGPPAGSGQHGTAEPRILTRKPDVVRSGFNHISRAARRAMSRVPDYKGYTPFWAV